MTKIIHSIVGFFSYKPAKKATPTEKVGYEFMKGCIDYVGDLIFNLIVLIATIIFIGNLIGAGVDDSDVDGFNRSRMKIYTDHKTGVQYLATREGVLTPRLNTDGTIVSIK